MTDEIENRIIDLEHELTVLKSGKVAETLKKEIAFRQAIEKSIPSGIAVVDDTGKQVYVNQSFCNLVGWKENELLNKYPPYVYWHTPEIEKINNAFQQTLNNNAPKEGFDLIFCNKTGKLIPVNVIISPFIQEDNKTFWLANVIDITERKQAEQALKESEEKYRDLFENASNSIVIINLETGEHIDFNRNTYEHLGFTKDEFIKLNLFDIETITPEEVAPFIEELQQTGRTKFETKHRKKSGELRDMQVNISKIIYKGKIAALGIGHDITDRKQAEKALKDSETKFKEIINQINDGIVVFDEQGKIVIFNKGAEQIFDLKAEDVLNSSIVDIQYQFAPPQFKDKALIEKVIKGIVTLQTPEIFNRIIDNETAISSGNIKNIQSIVFPIKFDNFNLFCSVFRDTTEIKEYEKQLLQLNADKDSFIKILAHDLKSPFNSIIGFLDLLTKNIRKYDIDKIEKQINIVNNSAKNTFNLLEDILLWIRANSGKIPFEPQKLNFATICNEVIENLKLTANTKDITIKQFATDEIYIFADINMLNTVLRNIVSNSIKFTNKGGRIDIYAEKNHLNGIITISDNGVGIEPDKINKLFDISQINSRNGTENEKGTGLGLLLCKEFVEKHSGKIWVESELGKGSDFKFTMPLSND